MFKDETGQYKGLHGSKVNGKDLVRLSVGITAVVFVLIPLTLLSFIALVRASDISGGRGPAKFRYFREIPRNPPEIFPNTCRKTYLILILAIRPVLFTPNVQI